MKIQNAQTTLEGHLAKSKLQSRRKVYQRLLGAIKQLQERDLEDNQVHAIEQLLEQLDLEHIEDVSRRELKKRSERFLQGVMKVLSLVSEDHYMTLGLSFGVALGAGLGSSLIGIFGLSAGTSSTGIGVGIGLIIGSIVAHYLDVEARKQNRVLITKPS